MDEREAWFEDLMDDPSIRREAELTACFLEHARKAVTAEFKRQALTVAADFDDFRRRARDEHGDPYHAQFFNTLSEAIKRRYPP